MPDNLPEKHNPGEAARYLSHADLDLMFRIAKAHALSGFFEDAAQEMKAFVIISAGREMGLMPFQSMQAIDVIKGKPVLNSSFLAQCVKQHDRYDYRVQTLDKDGAEITFFEDGVEIGKSTFDQEDARQAGLLGGKGQMYEKYPRNMLFARALSNGVAWFCPDVVGVRTYVEGELEDDYLADKAQRDSVKAAERLALEQAKAAAAGTAEPVAPAEPAEEVLEGSAEEEPEMGTAVKEPMTGTASATLEPKPSASSTTTITESTPGTDTTETLTPKPTAESAEKVLSERDRNILAIRTLVVSGLTGDDRKNCHEAMKFLEIWGEQAPAGLFALFGKKALTWKTLEPALNKAVAAEIARREKVEREAAEAAPSIPQDPDEPPFGEENVVDVTPEPDAPETPPWNLPDEALAPRVLTDEELEERDRLEAILTMASVEFGAATLDEMRALAKDLP